MQFYTVLPDKIILVEEITCEYSRLSFASATTCEKHVVAGANERRLYSKAMEETASRTFSFGWIEVKLKLSFTSKGLIT